jgi:hypothetical protein
MCTVMQLRSQDPLSSILSIPQIYDILTEYLGSSVMLTKPDADNNLFISIGGKYPSPVNAAGVKCKKFEIEGEKFGYAAHENFYNGPCFCITWEGVARAERTNLEDDKEGGLKGCLLRMMKTYYPDSIIIPLRSGFEEERRLAREYTSKRDDIKKNMEKAVYDAVLSALIAHTENRNWMNTNNKLPDLRGDLKTAAGESAVKAFDTWAREGLATEFRVQEAMSRINDSLFLFLHAQCAS